MTLLLTPLPGFLALPRPGLLLPGHGALGFLWERRRRRRGKRKEEEEEGRVEEGRVEDGREEPGKAGRSGERSRGEW